MSGNFFIYRHHVEPRVKLPLAERRIIPYSTENTLTSPELLIRTWESSKNDASTMIIGISMGQEICLILGQGFTQFTLWSENLQKDFCGPGRLTKTASDIQARSIYGQNSGEECQRTPSWGRSINGQLKNPKLDNAWKLRGIYFIDPEDKEFKETIKNARKKLETPMAPAMPCKTSKNSPAWSEPWQIQWDQIKNLRVFLEASESTRLRMEESLPNHHEDHIAGKGNKSLQHYNLVHKFIPMVQAMKIPAAKAAVDQEWEKLEKIPAWDLTKVRSKKEVIYEARTKGAKVHFASLMDLCHLKNAELETKHQTYKGRVVLRGDIVKGRFRVLRSIHWTRIFSISNDSRQNDGYHLQTARVRRTSSWCSIC